MKALPVILCAVVLPLCSAANAGEMVKTNVPASRSLARPNPQSEMDMIKVQNLVNQRAQSAAHWHLRWYPKNAAMSEPVFAI